MYVLTRLRIHIIIGREDTHEKDEWALQEWLDMNGIVQFDVQLKHKDLIKKEEERKKGEVQETDGEVRGEENKNTVSRGRVGAIDDLFTESPLRSLGPRYTFVYRRYL